MSQKRRLIGLWAVILVVLGITSISHPGIAADGGAVDTAMANAIEKIEASAISGQTLIKVKLRQPLINIPSSFTVSSPPRIAFDFLDTANASGNNAQQVSLSDLQSINVVQAGARTRLVLNLNHPSRYDARLDGGVLYVSLGGQAATSSVATSAAGKTSANAGAVAGISSGEGNAIQNVDFRAESTDVARVKIDLSDPNPLIDVKRQGNSLVLMLQNVKLPDRLARRLDVRDFGTPIVNVTTTALGTGTQLAIAGRGEWDYNVTQLDTSVKIEVRRVVNDPNSLGSAKEIQGKTVSFNFTQPVPVSQMIGIFQDITGLNFVMMPGVSGEIERMKMENTPVETAIDVVNRMYGLSMRRFGNLVVVGKAADLAKYEKDAHDLSLAQQDSEPIEQESIKVRHRPAAEIVAALTGTAPPASQGGSMLASPQSSAQPVGASPAPPTAASSAPGASTGKSMISARGSINYDPVSNVIFVEETQSQIQKIRERVDSLDQPVKQVMIEARIVSVGTTFSKALGAKLGFSTTNNEKVGSFGNHQVDIGPLNFNSAPTPVSGASTVSFNLFNPSGTRLLKLELDADQQDGTSKDIASPKILTQDGRQATISDGSTLFFQLSSANTGPTTVSVDASTKLDVTPQIGADGKITLKVYVNKGGVGPTVGVNPSVLKQEVTTNVVVENGGTLMLGGVFTETNTDTNDRVPVLGDIPYLGWLFKSNTKTVNRSELLIFITPRIVTEELTLQ